MKTIELFVNGVSAANISCQDNQAEMVKSIFSKLGRYAYYYNYEFQFQEKDSMSGDEKFHESDCTA